MQSPIHRAVTSGQKWSQCETGHSPPFTTEVKKGHGHTPTNIPPYVPLWCIKKKLHPYHSVTMHLVDSRVPFTQDYMENLFQHITALTFTTALNRVYT
jgi:hypothetical protein